MNPTPPETVWRPTANLALLALVGGVATLLAGWYSLTWSAGRPSLHERGPGAYRLDVNTADQVSLEQLPRLGSKLANAIVTHREQHGPFTSIDDLLAVKGIGPSHLAIWREYLTVKPDVDAPRLPNADPTLSPRWSAKLPPSAVAPPQRPHQPTGHDWKQYPAAPSPWKPSQATLPPQPLDVNTASLAELQSLPGIGPVLSERIVQARAQRPFTKADDLRRVPGIGPKTLEKIRPYLRFGPEPSDLVQD
jgi:competence protein ComEA